jgi:hypothetical protein
MDYLYGGRARRKTTRVKHAVSMSTRRRYRVVYILPSTLPRIGKRAPRHIKRAHRRVKRCLH